MKLAPEDINACRALVQWILRGAAALFLAAGSFFCLRHVLYSLQTGDFLRGIDLRNGLAMLFMGAALALGARRLSRWIVVLPSSGCPRCGHLRPPGGQDTRCPECGLDWSRR